MTCDECQAIITDGNLCKRCAELCYLREENSVLRKMLHAADEANVHAQRAIWRYELLCNNAGANLDHLKPAHAKYRAYKAARQKRLDYVLPKVIDVDNRN